MKPNSFRLFSCNTKEKLNVCNCREANGKKLYPYTAPPAPREEENTGKEPVFFKKEKPAFFLIKTCFFFKKNLFFKEKPGFF